MSDEVKPRVINESDQRVAATATESAQTISFLDLLRPAVSSVIDSVANGQRVVNGDDTTRSMKGVNEKEAFLQGRDAQQRSGVESSLAQLERVNRNASMKIDATTELKPATERLVLENMQDAISSGNVDKVQNMLKVLLEHPQSVVDHVLQSFQKQMASWDVSWEQGRDNHGQSFLRLHMNQYRDRGSLVAVTIGSDGRNAATMVDKNGPVVHLDIHAAIIGLKDKYPPGGGK